MKHIIKVLTISYVISMLIFGTFIFIRSVYVQETAYEQYKNQVHMDYCEIAISREASEAHLKSEGCIK